MSYEIMEKTYFETVNPATEEPIAKYEFMPPSSLQSILENAYDVFIEWRDVPVTERAQLSRRLAQALRGRQEELARIISRELGKPIKQSRAEVEKCAWTAEVYAENGPKWIEEETVAADGKLHQVWFEPLGVIISIMPWNFPLWQSLRFGIPSILAGNTTLLKLANNTTGSALALQQVFEQAGYPEHVFTTILAEHQDLARLIESDLVAGVSLTGSTQVGEKVGAHAAGHLKKAVLELGGSDPFIVLDDADVEFAAKNAVAGRMQNAGQSCIAAKRFIVLRPLADAFARRFAELAGQMVVGDPLDEKTEMGPLANLKGLAAIEEQVQDALEHGAQLLTGGKRLERKGYFYAPTVLYETTWEMKVMHEEVFGPVAAVAVVDDEEEAIETANHSEFGLGASIWTGDLERARRLARNLEAGCVFVNSIVKSDPRMPFGGVKKSGLGRELSKYGLREFVNVKSVNFYEHQGTAAETKSHSE